MPALLPPAPADAVPAESEPVFLPVEVEVATSPVRALATAPAGRIEIELSCGHRITAEGGFDVDVLARLLFDENEPYGSKRDVHRVLRDHGYIAASATFIVRFDADEISHLQDGHFQRSGPQMRTSGREINHHQGPESSGHCPRRWVPRERQLRGRVVLRRR